MRIALLALLLSACYPLRNARFVDESQGQKTTWLCVPDEDVGNPMGIQCADVRNLQAMPTPKKQQQQHGPAEL